MNFYEKVSKLVEKRKQLKKEMSLGDIDKYQAEIEQDDADAKTKASARTGQAVEAYLAAAKKKRPVEEVETGSVRRDRSHTRSNKPMQREPTEADKEAMAAEKARLDKHHFGDKDKKKDNGNGNGNGSGGKPGWSDAARDAAAKSRGAKNEKKDGGWIQKAVDPAHKGDCTPMTKKTCTPRRKALAKRFKKAASREGTKAGGKTGWKGKV